MIRGRLDRFEATAGWHKLFPSFDVRHFAAYNSDHSPPLCLIHRIAIWSNIVKKRFKFEPLWLSNEECKSVLEDPWVEGLGADIEFVLKTVLRSCLSRPSPPLVCYAKE